MYLRYERERLKEIKEKDAGRDGQAAVHKLERHSEYDMGEDVAKATRPPAQRQGLEDRKPSINERLRDVLKKRERLDI